MSDLDFLDEIRKLNGAPTDVWVDPELVALILPTLRADTEICETYDYQEGLPLACPIVAIAGKDDKEETVARMAEWRAQTTAEFSLHALPGGHFFIHSSEQQLVDLLRLEWPKKVTCSRLRTFGEASIPL